MSPNLLTEKACEDAAQGLRGLEVTCNVEDDMCCLGESKAIPLFLTIVCLVVCLASNAFPADFVSVCRMKKSNNKNQKKFFRRPETPASLPWRRETTRQKSIWRKMCWLMS